MVGEIHAVCNKFGLRALVGVESHVVSKSQQESLGGDSPHLFETEWIQWPGAPGADGVSDAAAPSFGIPPETGAAVSAIEAAPPETGEALSTIESPPPTVVSFVALPPRYDFFASFIAALNL